MYIEERKMQMAEFEVEVLDKEAVVFLPAHNKVVVLNQSALGMLTAIKELAQCCERITLEMIYAELMKKYNYVGIEKASLISDIREAVDSFCSSDLLEVDEMIRQSE